MHVARIRGASCPDGDKVKLAGARKLVREARAAARPDQFVTALM
jgi:hypothetical protein